MATAAIPRRPPFSSARRVLFPLLALLAVVYLADFAWYQLRIHLPKLGPATGSVHRIRLLAVPVKNNKVDYQLDTIKPEEDLACSHSLFPHGGASPCWYVTRHANDPIPM